MSYPTDRLTRIDAGKTTVTRVEVESRNDAWQLLTA
jgi:hypothetical protein